MDATFDRSMSLLCRRAERGDVVPAVPSLSSLPWIIRFAIDDVFAQIEAGELAALASIRRVLDEDPVPSSREFAQSQLRDEARHVEFFAAMRSQLRVHRKPMRELVAMFDEASSTSSLPGLLLANHLVVETLAHELFRDIGSAFRRFSELRFLPTSWRTAFSALSDSLGVVFRDESRHVAFGVLRLRELRASLSEGSRQAFDLRARDWEAHLQHTLAKLPVAFFLRPWFNARARAVLTHYRQRCADVGVAL